MMQSLLRVRWKFVLLFLLWPERSDQSIAGVTYMDDFDFEERYSNVDDCDPFYWHPLHLPEYCANMFERLIRSRIPQGAPIKFAKPRNKPKRKEKEEPKEKPEVYTLNIPEIKFEYPSVEDFDPYGYQIEPEQEIVKDIVSDERYQEYAFESPTLSPQEKIIYRLRHDVERHPAAPTIGFMPNLGQVAVYRQPISKNSLQLIKRLSKAYKKIGLDKGKGSGLMEQFEVDDKNHVKKIIIEPNSRKKAKKKKKHGHHRKNKIKSKVVQL